MLTAPSREDRLGARSLTAAVARSVRDVATASDPDLLRLRLGLRAVVALLLVVAVERVVAPAAGLPTLLALLLGGMVVMNGSFASSGRAPADAARTLAAFPLVVLAGLLPATLLRGHGAAELAGFVVVMTAAVFVRRWGARWFHYGMVAWLAYFFALFVGFRPGQLPGVLAVVVAATCCILAAATVLVPDRPDRLVAGAVSAFELRVDRLLAAGRAVVTGQLAADRAERVLHGLVLRVMEAALLVDGYLDGYSPPGAGAAGVRRGLLEAELAAEELSSAALVLSTAGDLPAGARAALVRGLDATRKRSEPQVEQAADELERAAGALLAGGGATARRLLDAAAALRRLVAALQTGPPRAPEHVAGQYEPAVTLFLGNLPGSAQSATGVLEAGSTWWSRRSLNTRLCVQSALAATLTVAAGSALSSQRYYWAVLACFLTLTGTVTTGETLVKGASRVIGTVGGLLAATVAVHLTGRSDTAIVAVMVVCVFLGLYLFRVSYVFMAFAITTVMGELYNVLREFTDELLLLRLAETALGAAIAIAVSLVVLPIRTDDARAAAERAFVDALAHLLDDLRDRLAAPGRTSDLFFDVRSVDAGLHQLALVGRPVGGPMLLGIGGRSAARDLSRFTAAAYRARALAVAVSRIDTGPHPELATRCAELAEALRTGWARGEGAPDGSEVARLLAELARVAEPLARSSPGC